MAKSYRSIFKQKCYEKLYYIDYNWRSQTERIEETWGDAIENRTLGIYDIEIPLLQAGEHFFLSDLEKEVIVEQVIRTSDGDIIYQVYTNTPELIETENTKNTLDECNKKLEENETGPEYRDVYWFKYGSLKKEFEDYKKKYKYKHRWFNFFTD